MEREVSYDSENDILYLNEGSSVQDSLDIGDFYLEFSGDGKIIGVEVLNASDTISQLTGEDFDTSNLESILDAKLNVHIKDEFAFVVLYICVEKDGEKVQESVGINVPSSTVAA